MENPIYNESNENPVGFGAVGKPKVIQNGILWEALVKTSECSVDNDDRKLVVARARYRENPHYLYAIAMAKVASELYPLAVVFEHKETIERYAKARQEMKEAYTQFVENYQRGSLDYQAIKPLFREMMAEA